MRLRNLEINYLEEDFYYKEGKLIKKSIKFNQSRENIRPSTSNAVWTREKSLTRQIDESVRMSFKPLSKR